MKKDDCIFSTLYYCPRCGNLQKHTHITASEVEILRYYAEGHTTKEIAKLRHSSIKTIEAHRQSALLKIGVRTITAAVVWAIQHNIVLLTKPESVVQSQEE